MSRVHLRLCVIALIVVLGSGSLAPAWAAGQARAAAPPAPAAAAAPHAPHSGVVTAFLSWLQAMVGQPSVKSGGVRLVINGGPCDDPNGHCQ